MMSNHIENFNYFEVEVEVGLKARECVRKNGYELMTIMKLSNHKDDYFLYLVIACKPEAVNGYQYVSWIYNKRGLDNGCYHRSFKNCMRKAIDRLNEIIDNENV